MADEMTSPELTTRQTGALSRIANLEEVRSAGANDFIPLGTRRDNQLARRIDQIRNRFDLGDLDSGARSTDDMGHSDYLAMGNYARRLSGRGENYNRASTFIAGVNNRAASRFEKEGRENYDKNIEPALDVIRERIAQLMDEPSIRATEEAQMKSRTIQFVRQQEADRIKRVGAVLGARGLDTTSPVAGLLVNRAAQEADAEIARLFQDLDLRLAEQRQQEALQETAMATNFAASEVNIRNNALSGNFDRSQAASSELAGLLESIQQQQEAMAQARGEFRDADKKSWVDYWNTGVGIIKDVFSIYTGSIAAGGGSGGVTQGGVSQGQSPAAYTPTSHYYGQGGMLEGSNIGYGG